MIQPYLIILIFLSFCLLTALANLLWIKRFENYPDPKNFPCVSILLPARNEEYHLAACVESLLNQRYPNFEVLVLDDHSTDDSPAILRQLKIRYPQLQIIQGEPLGEGWLGKHWACHQLAEKSTGELLLFTDADTRHQPDMLMKAVGALQKERADLVTAFPREEVQTLGEQLVVPIMAWGIHSFLPIRFAQLLHWAGLSVTIGQFMLFRRDAYEAVGGYEAVRQNIVDDVALGRLVIQEGYEWRLLDGTQYISCRMYRSFPDVMEGFSKNVFSFFDCRVLPFIVAWLLVGLMFIDPLLGVLSSRGLASLTSFPRDLAMIAVMESLVLWLVAYRRFHFPAYLVLLYPLSLGLFILIAFRSMLLTLTGHTLWKGREMKRGSIRWI
jgi:chlorobactene glucosyltransferase